MWPLGIASAVLRESVVGNHPYASVTHFAMTWRSAAMTSISPVNEVRP